MRRIRYGTYGHARTLRVIEMRCPVQAREWGCIISLVAFCEWRIRLLEGSATAVAQRGIGKTVLSALLTGDKIEAKF